MYIGAVSTNLVTSDFFAEKAIINAELGDFGRHVYSFILLTSFFIIFGLKCYSSGFFPDNKFKITTCALVMNQLAARLRNLLQSFKEHVMDRNTKGLVPKLMSNAQLSSECADSTMKEVVEQEDFLKFHQSLAAGN